LRFDLVINLCFETAYNSVLLPALAKIQMHNKSSIFIHTCILFWKLLRETLTPCWQ